MKALLLVNLILLGLAFGCQGQSFGFAGRLVEGDTKQKFVGNATILLSQADAVVTGAVSDTAGAFAIKNVKPGIYKVEIKLIGYRTETLEKVEIPAEGIANYTILFPAPCKWHYLKNKVPACVGGHTDHIIPIVYGLPGKRTMEKAKRGKVYLGGCEVYGCDPKYYCRVHKIML